MEFSDSRPWYSYLSIPGVLEGVSEWELSAFSREIGFPACCPCERLAYRLTLSRSKGEADEDVQ